MLVAFGGYCSINLTRRYIVYFPVWFLQNVGGLRLHSVIMETAAPKSAQRSKGHKKRPRGLKHMSQQHDGGFLTPARPNAGGAATHVQGKMRVFTGSFHRL